MDPAVVSDIKAQLASIQDSENVSIPLAVESGSRAWGFPSPDSDYDCRFIYVRRLDDAADLFPPRDVIEMPLTPIFDVNGWDLSKALKLMIKGNAVVLEWLQSPISYRRDADFCDRLSLLARDIFQREIVGWHYYRLLQNQLARHAEDAAGLTVKKLFYVLRPALALRFMRMNPDAQTLPMNIRELCAGSVFPAETLGAIDGLIAEKLKVRESGSADTPAEILQICRDEEEAAKPWVAPVAKNTPSRSKSARALYRELLRDFGPK